MEYLVDVGEGEESLIDPMQVDDVCALEFRQLGDVCTGIGNINQEEILPAELVGNEDAQAFPNKFDRLYPMVSDGYYGEAIGLFVANQHFSLDTVFFQGFHQSVGSNGCTADTLGCVDKKYSHCGNWVQRYGFLGEK